MDGERPFINGEFANVQEDHDAIIEWSNKEAMVENHVVKGGGCQIESIPQL